MSQKAISAQGLARCNWVLTLIYGYPSRTSVWAAHKPPIPLHVFLRTQQQRGFAGQTTGTPLRAAHTPRPGSSTLAASTGPATYY